MIPYILAAVGGYFLGSSIREGENKQKELEKQELESSRELTRRVLSVPKFNRSYADGGSVYPEDFSEETIEIIENYEKAIQKSGLSGKELSGHLAIIECMRQGDWDEAMFYCMDMDDSNKKMIPKEAQDMLESEYASVQEDIPNYNSWNEIPKKIR